MYKVHYKKSYTLYSEKDGKYYKQYFAWWENGGIFLPQAKNRCTKQEYDRMKNRSRKDNI